MATSLRCPRTISAGWHPRPILKSPENLNPQVTSGPFMMAESVPGDHYTLVRNPSYYRASEGLPYLDKVVFRIVAAGRHPQGSAGRNHHFGLITGCEPGAGVPAPHQLYAHSLLLPVPPSRRCTSTSTTRCWPATWKCARRWRWRSITRP